MNLAWFLSGFSRCTDPLFVPLSPETPPRARRGEASSNVLLDRTRPGSVSCLKNVQIHHPSPELEEPDVPGLDRSLVHHVARDAHEAQRDVCGRRLLRRHLVQLEREVPA